MNFQNGIKDDSSKGTEIAEINKFNMYFLQEVKKQGADIVIGVKFKSDNITEDSNIMDMTMKTIDIMGEKISEENFV
mgnify:CR=1 FL=1